MRLTRRSPSLSPVVYTVLFAAITSVVL